MKLAAATLLSAVLAMKPLPVAAGSGESISLHASGWGIGRQLPRQRLFVVSSRSIMFLPVQNVVSRTSYPIEMSHSGVAWSLPPTRDRPSLHRE